MAQYTTAYSSLILQLEEVITLRRMASNKAKAEPIRMANEINALCRSAVVLLSSHLEAYVRELGEVALDSIYAKSVHRGSISPRFYYHLSKDVLAEVRDTADHDRLAEKVFGFIDRDLNLWSHKGPFPDPLPSERFNQGFSNPSFGKVKAYLNRFGFSRFQNNLAAVLRADYQPTINMIDHLVDTRNKIAHGDRSATKTPAEVQSMTNTVRLFCRTTDHVFASWCKDELCSIR
jgi:hypothetical protein